MFDPTPDPDPDPDLGPLLLPEPEAPTPVPDLPVPDELLEPDDNARLPVPVEEAVELWPVVDEKLRGIMTAPEILNLVRSHRSNLKGGVFPNIRLVQGIFNGDIGGED